MADSNLPGTNPSQGQTPKKETVRISVPPKTGDAPSVKRQTAPLGAPVQPPAAPKPFMPLPSAPKPLAPASAPKPPALAPKPTIQLKPAPSASLSAAAAVPAAPAADASVPVKAAAPKKETARIQVPPPGKPVMPKPTVRMGQTQVLSAAPAGKAPSAALTKTAEAPAAAGADALMLPLSIAALVASLVAFLFSFLAFAA